MHELLAEIRNILELCPLLMAIGILTGIVLPDWWPAWLQPVERVLRNIASRRWLAVFVVGIAALVLRLALLPALPIPRPISHDEHAYVFAGQTFAAGRLANPSPPAPEFFESPHVLLKPTYVSKYQPGQGLLLAVGYLATGNPWPAVWLSFGMFCAAICWALQGWLPLRWAFFGGLIAIIEPGIFYYWVNGYWSGLLPAIGGALIVGTLGRLLRGRVCWVYGIPFGTGIVILQLTRIYEGLILIFAVAGVLAVYAVRSARVRSAVWATLPATAVIAASGLIWQGYYNFRTIGNVAEFPYALHVNIYFKGVPLLIGQKSDHHPSGQYWDIERLATIEVEHYSHLLTLQGIAERAVHVGTTLLDFGGVPLFIGLAMLVFFAKPGYRMRSVLIIGAITIAGFFTVTPYLPHYTAPAICLAPVLAMEGLRRLRLWNFRDRPAGLTAVRYAVLAALLCVLPASAVSALWLYRYVRSGSMGDCCHAEMTGRDAVAAAVSSVPGKHLVLVRFEPTHNVHESWIYNEADMNESRIIWARDLGDERNRKLLSYYPNRHVWSVDTDRKPLEVEPVDNSDTLPSVSIWFDYPTARHRRNLCAKCPPRERPNPSHL